MIFKTGIFPGVKLDVPVTNIIILSMYSIITSDVYFILKMTGEKRAPPPIRRNDRSDNPDDAADESPDDTVEAHESWDDKTSSTLFCL